MIVNSPIRAYYLFIYLLGRGYPVGRGLVGHGTVTSPFTKEKRIKRSHDLAEKKYTPGVDNTHPFGQEHDFNKYIILLKYF